MSKNYPVFSSKNTSHLQEQDRILRQQVLRQYIPLLQNAWSVFCMTASACWYLFPIAGHTGKSKRLGKEMAAPLNCANQPFLVTN